MSGLSGSLLVLTLRFLYFFSPGDRFSGVVYVPYCSPFCSGRGGAGSRLRLRPPSRPAPSPQTVRAPSARGRHDTRRRRGFHYHGALMTDDAQMGVSSQSRVLAGCSVPCSPSLRDALPSLPALVSRPPPPPRFCRATLTQQVAPRPPGVCLKGLRPTVSSRPLTLHATRPSRLYFLSVPSLRHFGHRPRPGRRPLSLERSSNSSASLPAPPQAPLLSVSCCDQSPPQNRARRRFRA